MTRVTSSGGCSRIGLIGSATNATGGTQAGSTIGGNLVAQSASFTRSGQIREVAAVDLASGAVDLESNNFYREYTDHIPLTEQAKALPTMQGSGRVRDLAEAVSLSSDLAAALTAFSTASTRDAQMALLIRSSPSGPKARTSGQRWKKACRAT